MLPVAVAADRGAHVHRGAGRPARATPGVLPYPCAWSVSFATETLGAARPAPSKCTGLTVRAGTGSDARALAACMFEATRRCRPCCGTPARAHPSCQCKHSLNNPTVWAPVTPQKTARTLGFHGAICARTRARSDGSLAKRRFGSRFKVVSGLQRDGRQYVQAAPSQSDPGVCRIMGRCARVSGFNRGAFNRGAPRDPEKILGYGVCLK